MKVLVTGAGGQVGHELVDLLGADGIGLTRAELDVTEADQVHAALRQHRPDAVVHAAAWTAVDDAEAQPETAFLVNETGTRHVAEAAREVGAVLCYLSTDYVFNGEKPTPYVEDDPTDPTSVYGASKLAGEVAAGEDALIVRTSWVCGFHGANMVKTILRLGAEGGPLRFVHDQRGHPTFARDLAAKVLELVRAGHTGVFHVTNQGAVSWYELALEVLEAAGLGHVEVQPVTTAEFARPAPRPANSVLENAALARHGIELPRHHLEPLREVVAQLAPDFGLSPSGQ